MESPSSSEPPTCLQGFVWIAGQNIGEIGETEGRFSVPLVHRVDSLGKLSAARLVDAACINPDVVETMGCGDGTGFDDFGEPRFRLVRIALLDLLEAHFAVTPRVREDRVQRGAHTPEVFELQLVCSRLEETHFRILQTN